MPSTRNPSHNPRLAARVAGKACAVLGYGISNRPLVEELCAVGARSVTVRDRRDAARMAADGDAARLAALGVTLICGEGYLEGLADDMPDLIFRTPGIRPDLPPIAAAVGKGAVLTSEMEMFLSLTPATVVALSGSDGKTTTTTLTGRILEAAARRTGVGRVFLGGNIGTPLLPLLSDMTEGDIAVVELSSFQLMTMEADCIPDRAALTNITPNHLNWHPDMAEYTAAKARLLGRGDQTPRMAVLNAENEASVALSDGLAYPVVWFSGAEGLPADYTPAHMKSARGDAAVFECEGSIICRTADGQIRPLLETARIRLPGRHNVENYMTAMALTCVPLCGLAPMALSEDAAAVADVFLGVPHRLEPLGSFGGVRYFNSSIDSSPARTLAALEALRAIDVGTRPPILICGGQDKHLSFAPLAEGLCRRASAVVLTGEARGQIMEALAACPLFDPQKLPVTVIPDYREAMAAACRMARPGDTVLLSPACTSFDAFRNFEERGDVFRKIVKDHYQV